MIPKPEKGKQTSSLSEIYAHLKCRKMPLEIHKSYRRGWGGTYLKYYTFDPCEPSGADIFCRYWERAHRTNDPEAQIITGKGASRSHGEATAVSFYSQSQAQKML